MNAQGYVRSCGLESQVIIYVIYNNELYTKTLSFAMYIVFIIWCSKMANQSKTLNFNQDAFSYISE